MTVTCKDCLHNHVCALWRSQEGQDAKSWSDSDDWDCDYFADKSRFVELPCKAVDTVYWYNRSGETIEAKIIRNGFCARIENGFEYDIGYDEIGKTVFLTREEAEAALAERRDK